MAQAAVQLSFPFETFEEELLDPIFGHKMTETEEFVANLLLSATSKQPIKNKEIINCIQDSLHRKVSEREVKDTIRSLRRHHAFPILSRRGKPAGYFWCTSTTEMKEFIKIWMSQYMDEMITLSVIVKRNYPRLAGQMRLKDIAEK